MRNVLRNFDDINTPLHESDFINKINKISLDLTGKINYISKEKIIKTLDIIEYVIETLEEDEELNIEASTDYYELNISEVLYLTKFLDIGHLYPRIFDSGKVMLLDEVRPPILICVAFQIFLINYKDPHYYNSVGLFFVTFVI